MRTLVPLLALLLEPLSAVREIPVPAAPGAGQANLAVTPDGRVLLSWIEAAGEDRHALRFAELTAAGTWGDPHTIHTGSGWFVNFADFPALAATPQGTLFAHWLERTGTSRHGYRVRVSHSRARGPWSEPVTPHAEAAEAEHGFVSMVPMPRGELGFVWLDGRKSAGEHAHQGTTALYFARLGVDGKPGAETELDARVCDCCQTAAAVTAEGLLIAYRDRSEDEVRDISVVRFVNGAWTASQPVSRDGWKIAGCPVNGPALAADGRNVALAWFAAPGDKAHARAAFSQDAGAHFGPPIEVDDGAPLGRVDVVLLADGGALVSWLEKTAAGAELRVRRVSRDGARGPALTVSASFVARSSGFPRMERAGSRVVLVWRDTAEPARIHTALLDL